MFQYEYEKKPASTSATTPTEWSRNHPNADRSYPNTDRSYPNADRTYPNADRSYPNPERSYPNADRSYPIADRSYPNPDRSYPSGRSTSGASSVSASVERARRPLPPRPIHDTLPTKTTVPLKVWVIASASCFAVCAALVLATVAITKWGSTETYTTRQLYELPEPIYAPQFPPSPIKAQKQLTTETSDKDVSLHSDELENDIRFPVLEKLSIFKNIVANRDKNKNKPEQNIDLNSKPQLHPMQDPLLHHPEKKIEKKDQPKYPYNLNIEETKISNRMIPNFKPTLPELVLNRKELKIIDLPVPKKLEIDYEEDEYYNDENLYEDYMQSNTMTSYLIEKVQELHDWITTDPDFSSNVTKSKSTNGNEFGQLLKALNESLIEGNVTIIMSKLKDLYFGENYTHTNHTRKVILSNSTDLLSFGILTLDVMLLHNIQLMAWENQESARNKMLRDPDVFAFNALFLEPGKVEAHQNELSHHYDGVPPKRPSLRSDYVEEFDIGKTLLENVLEVGMSTARAAIHLGRAYKNTKIVLTQLSNRESLNANIQAQISRNIDANSHALQHLQSSYRSGTNSTRTDLTTVTELDCVWLLYCKNLVVTSKLNPPYGTMARINGLALRMLTGELAADRALDTMLYEALTGWTELKCPDMFPRCSKTDAATVVLDSILAPVRKTASRS